jgi:hypothetical protein
MHRPGKRNVFLLMGEHMNSAHGGGNKCCDYDMNTVQLLLLNMDCASDSLNRTKKHMPGEELYEEL